MVTRLELESPLLPPDDPPRIVGIGERHRRNGPGSLTPAEAKMIFHRLDRRIRDPWEAELSAVDEAEWRKHGQWRGEVWGPLIAGVLGLPARVVGFVDPRAGDVIFDFGAGSGGMARALASRAPDLQYVGLEMAQETINLGKGALEEMVASKRLASAQLVQHNMVDGFPKDLVRVPQGGGKRRAMSTLAALYLPFDEQAVLFAGAFAADFDSFDLVAPEHPFFGPDVILAEVGERLESRIRKGDDPQAQGLKDLAERENSNLRAFANLVMERNPITSLDEATHYLKMVGNVERSARLVTGVMAIRVTPRK